jgi:hypothetical protein
MRRLKLVIVAVASLAAGIRSVSGEGSQPTSAVLNSPDQLRDCVLPLRDLSEAGVRWGMSARVTPANGAEWLLTMRQADSGEAAATLIAVGGQSLLRRFEEFPAGAQLTCDGASRVVDTKVRSWTSPKCRPLTKVSRELERLQWRVLPSGGLVFDATLVEVRMQGIVEEKRVLIQSKLPDGLPDEDPLARWVWRARSVLERECPSP